MKKLLLLICAGALITVTTYAQSLSLSWTGGAIANDQLITITGDTAGTVYSYIDCTNENADTLSVKVRKKYVSIVPGSENTFCWSTCYLPGVMVSPFFIDIQPDSVTHEFSGEYKAKGNIGITTVMYTFFDMNNENDSVCVQVAYDCSLGAGIEPASDLNIEFSNAYPNPANSSTSFTYNLLTVQEQAELVIRDMVGNIVSRIPVTELSGTLKVETGALSSGVYFYTLLLSDQPYFTKKLVVKH